MKALILAAGLGTRLRPLTSRVPKVMVPIEDGLPLLEHLVCHLKAQGITEFVINLHYLADVIRNHFGDGSRWGVRLSWSDETGQLLDTAGAVRKAAPLLQDDFLLVYGDQVHFYDFAPLIRLYREKRALAALALKRSDLPQNGDLAEVDAASGRIVRWHPRPHSWTGYSEGLYLNTGLYVLSPGIVASIPEERPVSLDREVLPPLVAQGVPIFGLPASEEILDIGTPEKYARARQWFARHPARRRKALFLDRDGVILRALPRGEYLTDLRQAALLDGISSLVKGAREAGYLVVVVTNQPQVGRGLLRENELRSIHRHMSAALGGGLDAVYYCPHTDSDGCECRKPKPGLLRRAAAEWNISPERSLMVGDSDRDVLAGRAAGCRTVFVRNEYNAAELARCSPDAAVDRPSEILSLL